MKFSRTSRVVAACLALVGLLFMQLAVASYACPGTGSSETSMSTGASGSMANMSGCDGMDKAQPALCHASAHPHDQALDAPQLPTVQPFMAAQVFVVPVSAEFTDFSGGRPASSDFLKRTTAPPIAIRHCCFRI